MIRIHSPTPEAENRYCGKLLSMSEYADRFTIKAAPRGYWCMTAASGRNRWPPWVLGLPLKFPIWEYDYSPNYLHKPLVAVQILTENKVYFVFESDIMDVRGL